jgi:hypothetical protein
MVGPTLKALKNHSGKIKKSARLKMSFEDFINTLDKEIPLVNRKLSAYRPVQDSPIQSQFVINFDVLTPSNSFKNFIENDIDYIHSSLSSQSSSAKEFL